MELFVTIGICKVLSCRLIIFYTQCCPMSVFICVSSLLVPFRFWWFHLEQNQNFTKIVFYWTMVLIAQFLSMNFLFFVSVRCWVHLVPGGSSLFKVVPAGSSSFQVVLAHSRCFQLLPCFNMYRFQMIIKDFFSI